MAKSIAIVFPGQGAQSVGMLADLAAAYPVVRHTFEEGSEALGQDLWRLSQQGPAESLNETRNTQPAMLCAGIAAWRAIEAARTVAPAVAAGHSLGEYSALVAADALALGDAVRLVARRAEFMQAAVPRGAGAMAAILGLDDDTIRRVCEEGAEDQVVEAVNFNAPGQVVIAGNAEAVKRTADLAKQAGAKRALLLDVSVPSHCALMRPAAERLSSVLAAASLSAPRMPVLHNVTVEVAEDTDQMRALLLEQLYRPVRWVETVQAFSRRGIDLVVEAGPGKVLTGLGKRIDKTLPTLPVFDSATLDQLMETIDA
jgi:[acyl-carrier-protein] S-malonyltransferase